MPFNPLTDDEKQRLTDALNTKSPQNVAAEKLRADVAKQPLVPFGDFSEAAARPQAATMGALDAAVQGEPIMDAAVSGLTQPSSTAKTGFDVVSGMTDKGMIPDNVATQTAAATALDVFADPTNIVAGAAKKLPAVGATIKKIEELGLKHGISAGDRDTVRSFIRDPETGDYMGAAIFRKDEKGKKLVPITMQIDPKYKGKGLDEALLEGAESSHPDFKVELGDRGTTDLINLINKRKGAPSGRK